MNQIEITARIKALQTEIIGAQDAYRREISSYNSWFSQSQEPCKFVVKSKQEECKKDRAFKLNNAKARQTAALSFQATADRKTSEMKALQEALASISKQAETLAGQGIVYEAEVIEAQGKAEAVEIAAQAQTDALKSAQTRKTIIVLTVVVVLVGVVVVITRNKLK